MKKILLPVLLLTVFAPSLALAQMTQYYLEDKLNNDWKVRIYVVAGPQAKGQVQDSLYHSVEHAREALKRLDAGNPAGELSQINSRKTRGEYMVSKELAWGFATALNAAKMTGGAFDFVRGGTFRDVSLQERTGKLSLKRDNLFLDLKQVQQGVLADLVTEDLTSAGWKNCLVKIGSVFVARGSDVGGPWKIPVFSPTDRLASRMLFYKVREDLGSATFPPFKEAPQVASSDLKSATLFAGSGGLSEGLAAGLYVMGFENAKKFLNRNKKLRGVLGTGDGEFVHVPAWRKASGEKIASTKEKPLREEPLEKEVVKEKPVKEKRTKEPKIRAPIPADEETEAKPHSPANTL